MTIRGLHHFADFFKDLREDFAVIGGTAATMLLDEAGLEFRATKDIDIVIIAAESNTFAERMIQYVKHGRYEIQRNDATPRFYRFLKPQDLAFPVQIELFHKKPDGIELFDRQHIVPIKASPQDIGISAILLEDDYFELIKNNVVTTLTVPSITTEATIVLKAKAYNDLLTRQQMGEKVELRQITKHRNDIFRLLQGVATSNAVRLHGLPREHFEAFLRIAYDEVKLIEVFQGLNLPFSPEEAVALLKRHFLT